MGCAEGLRSFAGSLRVSLRIRFPSGGRGVDTPDRVVSPLRGWPLRKGSAEGLRPSAGSLRMSLRLYPPPPPPPLGGGHDARERDGLPKKEDMMAAIYEKKNNIAYITIDNPKKANILDRQTSDELAQIWKEVWEDWDVRVAILTGAGDRHFCAGHNLAPRPDVTEEERERIRAESLFWPMAGTVNGARIGADGRLGDHYPQIWKPVVAAINGWAAGAGFYLVLTSTDIRLACEEHARFKFALLSQGWVGSGPGATYLTRQVAYADAMRILLTDEPFDAEEARRINLINEVVPHDRLMGRAEEIATHIAGLPPLAVRMMKEFVIRFREIPVTEAWRVQTLMNALLTQVTADGDEGRAAFLEKREPDFTGAIRQKGSAYPEVGPDERARLDEIARELLG